jgi:hypothetical protein
MLDKIYYWIGWFIFWARAGYLGTSAIGIFIAFTLNKLSEHFKILWVIFEFSYYKKEFLEWVKNKERHPKAVK